MDFKQFEVETEKPVFVQFVHPFTNQLLFEQRPDPDNPDGPKVDDIEKPVGANIYGQDSKKFRDRQRQLLDKKVADAQRMRNAKKAEITQSELERQNRDTVTACIDSFVNVSWEGEDLGGQRDKFGAFFEKHPWAFDFCNRAVMDRANFQKT